MATFLLMSIPAALWEPQGTWEYLSFFACSVKCQLEFCTGFEFKDNQCRRGLVLDAEKTPHDVGVTLELFSVGRAERRRREIMANASVAELFERVDLLMGDHLYAVGKSVLAWEAKEQCEGAGGILAMPRKKEFVERIRKELPDKDLWFGLRIDHEFQGACGNQNCTGVPEWLDGEKFAQVDHYDSVYIQRNWDGHTVDPAFIPVRMNQRHGYVRLWVVPYNDASSNFLCQL